MIGMKIQINLGQTSVFLKGKTIEEIIWKIMPQFNNGIQ